MSQDSDFEVDQEPTSGLANGSEMLKNEDPDTLRIMLSTDNHLGYNERDNVRGMDSFAAFEEVLYLAKRFHCDMVLIAGDLFHDNRPSRRTLHKTMEILRRYCMGPGAVKIQLLSDPKKQFRSAENVNYQNPNYAVDLPIFSIHGNHDDPSRDQGGEELLAALDLLAVTNLVNYFGRQDEVDKVDVSPILLKKGDTKVALYGLGSLRDERLNRMWERKKVRFLRPEDDDGDDDGFFNIFTLHQNRDLGRGAKNCVQENMIPEWMDLVVWVRKLVSSYDIPVHLPSIESLNHCSFTSRKGHEHECLIEFFESVVGTFRITQPGSSVATSLVSGEAARKKVGILDVRGKNFRLHPVPLTQVRSFVTTEITLREHRAELDPDDPKIDKKVTSVLEEEVQLLTTNAREKNQQVLRDSIAAGSDAGDKNCTTKYKLQRPSEVLVRIRVEHNGFSTINNQRFGAKFVGEVANPVDILLFHRKKDPKLASTVKKKGIHPIAPQQDIERTSVDDLVREHLNTPEGKLRVLSEEPLTEAMDDYVEKSRTSAIVEAADKLLSDSLTKLLKQKGNKDMKEAQIADMISKNVPKYDDLADDEELPTAATRKTQTKLLPAKTTGVEEGDADDDDFDISMQESRPSTKKPSARKRKDMAFASSSKRQADRFDELDDSDEEVEVAPPKAATGRPTRTPKAKVSYAADEGDEDDESDAKKTAKAPARKTKVSATSRKKAKPASRRNQFDDSDEEMEYPGENSELNVDWGSAATKSQRSQWS